MDTSKEYVLMCEQAKEIQENKDIPDWKLMLFNRKGIEWGQGDWYYYETIWKDASKNKVIWLPRQDQLQGMLKGACMLCYTSSLDQFFQDNMEKWEKKEIIAKMEQLWLAFIMSENYDKIWTGKKRKKND